MVEESLATMTTCVYSVYELVSNDSILQGPPGGQKTVQLSGLRLRMLRIVNVNVNEYHVKRW